MQVRVEVGSRLQPLPPDAVIRLERNGPAVPLGPFFTLAYVGDTFVVQALRRNPLPSVELPFGLDVYRGDVPIVPRTNPRCDRAVTPGCQPDTSLAFVQWVHLPTEPENPLVLPLPPVRTVQARIECGFSYVPCGSAGLLLLEQDGPEVVFSDERDGYKLAYRGNTVVMTALQAHEVQGGLPYGLDIYRGDLPLVGRQSPRCNPAEGPVPCTPDTAVGFIAWSGFPTDPAVPRVVPLEPWP